MKPTLSKYIKICNFATLKNIRNIVNAEFNKRISGDRESGKYKLTPRQVDVMRLCLYSRDKIAEKLNLSEAAVASHIRQANIKMKTHSKEECLFKSINLGLIKINEVELP